MKIIRYYNSIVILMDNMEDVFVHKNIWEKIVCIATDGGSTFIGKKEGVVILLIRYFCPDVSDELHPL